jgi:hypothetical protein
MCRARKIPWAVSQGKAECSGDTIISLLWPERTGIAWLNEPGETTRNEGANEDLLADAPDTRTSTGCV